MDRRGFLTGALAGSAAIGVAGAERQPAPGRARQGRLKVGHQHHSTDADLRVLAALGVRHICSALPSRTLDENWSADGLARLRERVERFGIALDMVPLPLSNTPIGRAENPSILGGKSPERDREIDRICEMVRNTAKAGIPALKYNLTILGVLRTESSRGRGGARYSTFVHSKAKDGPPPAETGAVGEEVFWERIEYFLKRVVPVARRARFGCAAIPTTPPYRVMASEASPASWVRWPV
jgi:mannonate dehydratase